jgi:hypothetical protein
MVKVVSTNIFAVAPTGSSAPDSITAGGGSIWVEYGNGADSTGKSGDTTIVEYSMLGQVEHTYTLTGLADGLKYDPATGDVWALLNNDGNSQLVLIDPATNQVSAPLNYGAPYVYGTNSTRGFDDAAFDGKTVFLSETNPANPGDPVVVKLLNGNAPFGQLETTPVLSFGDTGTNLVTGKQETLPITDPDSLKLLHNGSLLLTGETDGAFVFINHPGTAQQTASFVDLPTGYVPDDAIMPTSSSGTFFISNQGANNVMQVQVKGLNTHDFYADIANKNELVQIDPRTGEVTTLLTGLSSPHGLLFQPAAHTDDASQSLHDVVASLGPDLKQSLVGSLLPTTPQSTSYSTASISPSGGASADMATAIASIFSNHAPNQIHG